MENKKKHIGDLHFEHQLWKSETKFYEDELKIYQERLSEVAIKNNKQEISKQVEHFQNQFIIQEDQLDKISDQIRGHEKILASYAKEHPVAVDHKLFDDHKGLHEKVTTFKKLYGELKTDFTKFIEKWM